MEYTLIRSKKRHRSAALQVSSTGEVVVSAPWYMPRFMLDKFVDEHKKWINKRLIELAKPIGLRVKYFPTEEALQDFIITKLLEYETKMDLHSTGYVFKHVTTYWGSCSPTGKISFNMEMIYAPPDAVEYIIVHELAHLRHRGHGVRFWAMVNKFFPTTSTMRKVLRTIGHSTLLAR